MISAAACGILRTPEMLLVGPQVEGLRDQRRGIFWLSRFNLLFNVGAGSLNGPSRHYALPTQTALKHTVCTDVA